MAPYSSNQKECSMSPAELLALPVVKARNALGAVDADTIYAVIEMERAGKARGIILDAAASRLRARGLPAERPVTAAPELTVTCTRDRLTTATGDEEIGRLFGWRMMGGTRKHQPQCRKCRAMPPIKARVKSPAEDAAS